MVILGGGLLVALLGIGIAWFLAPNVRGGGETVEVPTLEGGTLEQARQAVGEDFEIVGDGDPQAVIQSQEPEPGARAERGSEISVVLGAGEVATVPDVLGRTQEEAEEMLRSEGFEVEVETREGPEGLAGQRAGAEPLGRRGGAGRGGPDRGRQGPGLRGRTPARRKGARTQRDPGPHRSAHGRGAPKLGGRNRSRLGEGIGEPG